MLSLLQRFAACYVTLLYRMVQIGVIVGGIIAVIGLVAGALSGL